MHSARARSLFSAASVLLTCFVTGCGGGATPVTEVGSPFDAGGTTTSAAAVGPQPAPTVAPIVEGSTQSTTLSNQTIMPRGLDTTDAASQNLWDSWRDNDRSRALLFASSSAVDTLFETRWQPDARNEGCGTVVGINRCVYTFTEKTQLVARLVIMVGSDATGYRATRVERVGDLPTTNRLDSPLVDDTLAVGTGTDVVPAGDVGVGSDPAVASGGSDAAGVAPTVPASATATGGGASPRPRVTSKKTKTTKRKSTKVTTAAGTVGPVGAAPAAAAPADATPAPKPSPAPASGPVPVGGHTVDTVASS